ncbi:potassium-transporting ATPase subunit KdpA [Escherichia coli]
MLVSSLFAVVTTAASCGAVIAMMIRSPLSVACADVADEIGEVVFGGVGSGLYGMMLFVLLAGVHCRADDRLVHRNIWVKKSTYVR